MSTLSTLLSSSSSSEPSSSSSSSSSHHPVKPNPSTAIEVEKLLCDLAVNANYFLRVTESFYNKHNEPGDDIEETPGLHDPTKPSPLDPEMFKALPSLLLKRRVLKQCKDKQQVCCICYDSWKLDDTIKILQCTHFFHTQCIQLWFNQDNRCPLCYYHVSAKETTATQSQPVYTHCADIKQFAKPNVLLGKRTSKKRTLFQPGDHHDVSASEPAAKRHNTERRAGGDRTRDRTSRGGMTTRQVTRRRNAEQDRDGMCEHSIGNTLSSADVSLSEKIVSIGTTNDSEHSDVSIDRKSDESRMSTPSTPSTRTVLEVKSPTLIDSQPSLLGFDMSRETFMSICDLLRSGALEPGNEESISRMVLKDMLTNIYESIPIS